MLVDTRQRCADLRLGSRWGSQGKRWGWEVTVRSANREEVTVIQQDGSEEGSHNFRGLEEDVKSAEASF